MDIFNMNFDMSGVYNSASTFVGWLVIIFYMILAALLLWGCMYLLSFKHLVRVRQATASGYVVVDTKAREFTTKDKVKKWRFLKLAWIRNSVPAPPTEYFELTSKGKFCAECDRTSDGGITWRKRNGVAEGVDAFTGEERMITGMEMRRANDYKKDSWTDKLWQLAPLTAVIVVLVLVFAFYGDLTKVGVQSIDRNSLTAERLADTCIEMFNKIDACDCKVSNTSIKVNTKGVNVPPIPN